MKSFRWVSFCLVFSLGATWAWAELPQGSHKAELIRGAVGLSAVSQEAADAGEEAPAPVPTNGTGQQPYVNDGSAFCDTEPYVPGCSISAQGGVGWTFFLLLVLVVPLVSRRR